MQLKDLVTKSSLRQLAGGQSFSRGAGYAADRRVTLVVNQPDSVDATVRGEQDYEVRLWVNGTRLAHSCTCPVGRSGAYCKHAVAVGLAYLDEALAPGAEPIEPVVTSDDIRAFLSQMDRDELVAMILEQAKRDEPLQRRLLARAARAAAKRIDQSPYLRAIESAVWTDGFVDYRAMRDYSDGIYTVIGSLRDLLGQGYAGDVLELADHFIAAVAGEIGHVDDSGGTMGGILDSLQNLHHEACQQARPDPEELADLLYTRELGSEYDVFSGAAQRYADVLGEKGLARFRQLAAEEWERVPALEPGEKDSIEIGRRYRITQVMETLARERGDVEALVAVMARDRSQPHRYLRIAQAYRDAGQPERVLAWAEEGLKSFPERPDARLREIAAEEYHRLGRHDDAMELIWSGFAKHPSPGGYQNLKRHATMTGGWPSWREKALELIRADLARQRANPPRWGGAQADGSILVEVFLSDGEVETAWAEASDRGCRDELWLELAGRREVEHPADALPIFQRQVEDLVSRKNNQSYEGAAQLVRRARNAYLRLGRPAEFSVYLEDLKARHRRYRNFSALLRDLEGEAP